MENMTLLEKTALNIAYLHDISVTEKCYETLPCRIMKHVRIANFSPQATLNCEAVICPRSKIDFPIEIKQSVEFRQVSSRGRRPAVRIRFHMWRVDIPISRDASSHSRT